MLTLSPQHATAAIDPKPTFMAAPVDSHDGLLNQSPRRLNRATARSRRRVKHERASRLGAGDGCRIAIGENAGAHENADLAPDALGVDAAAFLGAHDVAHQ